MPKGTRGRTPCSVDGCDEHVNGDGFCGRHQKLARRYGDPLAKVRARGDTDHNFWRKVYGPLFFGCWTWTGSKTETGYGQICPTGGKLMRAHVWAYQRFVGPIPDGYDVDHVCHNIDLSCPGGVTCPHRLCVNPFHLEAVTHQVNSQRGRCGAYLAARTECIHGHEYTEANTIRDKDGHRHCRECKRIEGREYQRRKRAERG